MTCAMPGCLLLGEHTMDAHLPMSAVAPQHPIVVDHDSGIACGEDIHGWFELSYSSYLVLPRSLLQVMPAEWQHQMVALLERMHEEFPGERSRYAVFKRGGNGHFEPDPLRSYRHPDPEAIDAARRVR